jgi:signal peptidase I
VSTGPDAPSPTPGRLAARLKDLAVITLAAVAAAMFLRLFVVEAYHIPSHSMEPALLAGDRLLVSRLFYGARVGSFVIPGWSLPERGEVIVFELPSTADVSTEALTFVKRCVAVPGDTIASDGGDVWVNGALVGAKSEGDPAHGPGAGSGWRIPLPGEEIPLTPDALPFWHPLIAREGHRVEAFPSGEVRIDGELAATFRVTENHYFVLGDNRSDSYDSRQWGLLPEHAVIGKAVLVYWSREDSAGGSGEIRWSRIGTLVR